jgi:hypothetical protein
MNWIELAKTFQRSTTICEQGRRCSTCSTMSKRPLHSTQPRAHPPRPMPRSPGRSESILDAPPTSRRLSRISVEARVGKAKPAHLVKWASEIECRMWRTPAFRSRFRSPNSPSVGGFASPGVGGFAFASPGVGGFALPARGSPST